MFSDEVKINKISAQFSARGQTLLGTCAVVMLSFAGRDVIFLAFSTSPVCRLNVRGSKGFDSGRKSRGVGSLAICYFLWIYQIVRFLLYKIKTTMCTPYKNIICNTEINLKLNFKY